MSEAAQMQVYLVMGLALLLGIPTTARLLRRPRSSWSFLWYVVPGAVSTLLMAWWDYSLQTLLLSFLMGTLSAMASSLLWARRMMRH